MTSPQKERTSATSNRRRTALINGNLVEKLPSYAVLLTPPHLTTSLTSHITHHSHHSHLISRIIHITHISYHASFTSLTSHITQITHHSSHTSHITHHSHLTSHITHIIHIIHLLKNKAPLSTSSLSLLLVCLEPKHGLCCCYLCMQWPC